MSDNHDPSIVLSVNQIIQVKAKIVREKETTEKVCYVLLLTRVLNINLQFLLFAISLSYYLIRKNKIRET